MADYTKAPNSHRDPISNTGIPLPLQLWICNMVEFPFVIRQSVFNRIGLNQSYGEAMLLDFFLRSNGTLKIAVSHRCIFSKSQSIDKQSSGTKRQVNMDYGLLGHNHNILRIVRQDSITWTKCSSNNSSCPDIPEEQNKVDNILLPYCCKTALNQILMHTVDALNQIGTGYRVCFGTLLGAIRSKTIIPWTQDVDICLKSEHFTTQTFEKLKELLLPSNFSLAFLESMHRVVPLNAFVKHLSNHSLVTESDLFSEQALQFMQEMLPVPAPLWLRFTYADLYKYDKLFKNNAINVTIDGLEYCSGDKPHELLREWFGSKYMSTDENDRATSPTL
ncbi:uncharacterized protein LOC116303184 [Actinia tenebrosa]|uniref:Uncharacterized protein LOC116303184 n=1 Tax=Actinia tenebrosa TaxID=6105 RepID=A0A6P8INY5_ACTTE|nr:uncharacterized protein LOC116303184 [Actinia tenebrosa]